jgi:hypothetical protein
MKNTKHIVCYSGGHSSALVAIEVVKLFGKENVILLNHNINPRYEDADIKRFKKEVADYLGLPITFANIKGIENENNIPNQFEVCEERKTFVNPHNRQILCTYALKTEPFYDYLKSVEKESVCCYYGFDSDELNRVERRKSILIQDGIETDFPLALWSFELVKKYNDFKINELLKTYNKANKSKLDKLPLYVIEEAIKHNLLEITEYDGKEKTINSTKEIGIEPPLTYKVWKHANCKGCLKAGQQHWYVVYCEDNETFERAKLSEERIGHSFGNFGFLKEVEPTFKRMKEIGIPANEHISSHKFWKSAKHYLKQSTQDLFPCECFT